MSNEFTYKMRVFSEDTDSFGLVHHANFIKFMERARTEWVIASGFQFSDLLKQGIGFVVKNLQIDYRKPARVYEELLVKTRVAETGKTSQLFEHIICSASSQDHIYCQGNVLVVCVDENIKPRSFPEEWLKVIS